jgi:hypothetical protein
MKFLPKAVEDRFLMARFAWTRRLADRRPEEVWPGIGDVDVTVRPFAGRFGNVSPYELLVLCAVARWTRAAALFEFGTYDGRTTWHLVHNCPDAHLWTLDLPPDHADRFRAQHHQMPGKMDTVVVGGRFAGTPEATRIEQLHGDSLQFDAAPYRGRIDFCFVDAGHDHEHVLRDTENALTMTRPGGSIFWHDYSPWWPGLQRCLDDLSRRLPLFRVEGTALAAVRLP